MFVEDLLPLVWGFSGQEVRTNQLMKKQNSPALRSLHLPQIWWWKWTQRSLLPTYLQEMALAKIILLGWSLKELEWQQPSLERSPDVRPASDPEPGLGRKVEGGQEEGRQPWVGSPC